MPCYTARNGQYVLVSGQYVLSGQSGDLGVTRIQVRLTVCRQSVTSLRRLPSILWKGGTIITYMYICPYLSILYRQQAGEDPRILEVEGGGGAEFPRRWTPRNVTPWIRH